MQSPATNIFRVNVEEGQLHVRLAGFRFPGLPLPAALCPACHAVESQVDGRSRFDVPISLPGLGTIIHYTGLMDRHEAGPVT